MDGNGTGISRLDSYEDMFKEITRKLYGEDPDHRTSNVQNEFETSVTYKNDEDTGNGTDGSDDGNWTYEEEPLKGTDGSRIAAYHAGKATWRCDECGDIMGGGPREVAEHFVELHPSRILTDTGRNRHHSPRKDYLQIDFKMEDVILYLERLRERAERLAPPTRRTQETQTVPAALLPVHSSNFLLQELASAPASHLQQNSVTMAAATASANGKRYCCSFCPYGTDRRDLFTRHENIHREEKPFHCYVCFKTFNRADHVKKHFMRMHREHTYELARIRRPPGSNPPKPLQQDSGNSAAAVAAAAAVVAAATAGASGQQQPQQQHTASYQPSFASNKSYQLQPNTATTSNGSGTIGIYQTTTMTTPSIMQPDQGCNTVRRLQNGCNSKSHTKSGSKGTQERRYSCVYCNWSGLDNWCLKRHVNTHTKPFACTLCEYKAARAERLSTHVLKVHNKRQCSRCAFLAEDLNQLQIHQLHAHRVNNTSAAPSTSIAPTVPPLSNRHQQPLHPVGGRPPPGPPVFPAPIPAIAPAPTVMPSVSEMVKSPATAATMAYPTEEGEEGVRRSHPRTAGGIEGDDGGDDGDSDDDGDDDGDVVRGNGNRDAFSRRIRGITNVSGDDLAPSDINGNDGRDAIDPNADFACSFASYATNLLSLMNSADDLTTMLEPIPSYGTDPQDPDDEWMVDSRNESQQEEKESQENKENKENRDARREKRKQSHPQRVKWNRYCDPRGILMMTPALGRPLDDYVLPRVTSPPPDISQDPDVAPDDPALPWDIERDQPRMQLGMIQRSTITNIRLARSLRRRRQKLRCRLCPANAPARGLRRPPYHTGTSLMLHKLWRHRESQQSGNKRRAPTPSASWVTLKATLFTDPNYQYHR